MTSKQSSWKPVMKVAAYSRPAAKSILMGKAEPVMEEDMQTQQLKAMLGQKTQAAEKAAMALIALRCTRAEGVTGVGPNKDDYPVFMQLTEARLRGETPDKDLIYQVTKRVGKYARQLSASRYAAQLSDDSHKVVDFVRNIQSTIAQFKADKDLAVYLKAQETQAYGEW